jgi:hypothetical protein
MQLFLRNCCWIHPVMYVLAIWDCWRDVYIYIYIYIYMLYCMYEVCEWNKRCCMHVCIKCMYIYVCICMYIYIYIYIILYGLCVVCEWNKRCCMYDYVYTYIQSNGIKVYQTGSNLICGACIYIYIYIYIHIVCMCVVCEWNK